MQISSSFSSVSGYSAMSQAFGSQNMNEMDAKVSADIFKAKDSDKSGSLSASELGVSSSQITEFDTDGDGEVSSSELVAGLKAKREKMQSSMENQRMQDGQMGLLQASMGGMKGGDMSRMDARMSQKIMDEKDADQDGMLSASELGVSAANLSKVDADGDGKISQSELTASLKSHREAMMAENGGAMPPPLGGAEGTGSAEGRPGLDTLISGLFGGASSGTQGVSAAGTDSAALTGKLADFLLRQKASSAYQNMDNLIASLFGDSGQSEQSLSLSA